MPLRMGADQALCAAEDQGPGAEGSAAQNSAGHIRGPVALAGISSRLLKKDPLVL